MNSFKFILQYDPAMNNPWRLSVYRKGILANEYLFSKWFQTEEKAKEKITELKNINLYQEF